MDNNGTKVLSITLDDNALHELKSQGFTHVSGVNQYDEIMLITQSCIDKERKKLLQSISNPSINLDSYHNRKSFGLENR